MNDILLFDIDLTLFNYNVLLERFYEETSKHFHVDVSSLKEARERYKTTLDIGSKFSPKAFTVYLANELDLDEDIVFELFYHNEPLYRESLYSEVNEVLEALRDKVTMGIYSEGLVDYQKNKIKRSGIYKYFERNLIFISENKLGEETVSKLPEKFTLVDDRLHILQELQTHTTLKAIWLNRLSKEKDTEITTIHTLKELLKIYV